MRFNELIEQVEKTIDELKEWYVLDESHYEVAELEDFINSVIARQSIVQLEQASARLMEANIKMEELR